MDSEGRVIVTADGAVLSASGGAPAEWVGTLLTERPDIPATVRQAVEGLLRDLYGSVQPLREAQVAWPSTGAALEIVAIEAIPLRRVSVDPRVLVDTAAQTMRQQTEAVDVDLRVEIDDALPSAVSLDAEKVAWIITVLIGNALRFVRHGSRLLPGGTIAVDARYDATTSEIVVSVKDDGPGIPDNVLPFLFERSPDRLIATGLGLKLARDTVAAHGGRLEVETRWNTAESGTTVRLTFPAVP
jgi:signal transduction histidine kinase